MVPFVSRPTLGRLLGPLLAIAVAAAVATLGLALVDVVRLPPAVLMVFGIAHALPIVGWRFARIELEPTRVLRASGPWPGRHEEVDLGQLTSAAIHRHAGVGHRGLRAWVELELADANGRRLRTEPQQWAQATLLLAAVRQAADARNVTVADGDLLGLGPAPPPPPQPRTWGDRPPPALDLRPEGSLRAATGIGGAAFALVAAAFVLVGLPIALLVGAPPLSLVPVLILAAVFGVLGLLGVLWALVGRLRLASDGTLTVRRFVPWGTRRVSLAGLASVSSGLRGWVSLNREPPRPRVQVTLRDRAGRRLLVEPGAWQRPDVLAPTLAAWAATSGVELDPATTAYLTRGTPPLARPSVSP